MIESISKEQFLIEHNRLSPAHLQTTFAALTLFQESRKLSLKGSKGAAWNLNLRVPLILWLTSLPSEKKKEMKESAPRRGSKPKEQIYRNYPETHDV